MEQTVIKVAKAAIYDAVSKELVGYNKPLSNFTNSVLLSHEDEFKTLIDSAVTELLNATDFKIAVKDALHTRLAKILINKMSGELEKKVNELKQDPTTRAKITLAINKVMEDVL